MWENRPSSKTAVRDDTPEPTACTTSARPTLSLKRASASDAPLLDERLHKVLANAGLGSRRLLEQRIEAGEVMVNAAAAGFDVLFKSRREPSPALARTLCRRSSSEPPHRLRKRV